MTRSSFTAPAEVHILYTMLGDGETSQGVQQLAIRAATTDPEVKAMLDRANKIVILAREELGTEDQRLIINEIRGNYARYLSRVPADPLE
jgi:hypothetical protein